jgi:hypothetical protein
MPDYSHFEMPMRFAKEQAASKKPERVTLRDLHRKYPDSRDWMLHRLYVLTREPPGSKPLSSREVNRRTFCAPERLEPEDFKSSRKLKLAVELVPTPLWRKTLRYMLSKSLWERIREIEMDRTPRTCEICGVIGEQCHEKWLYDDERHIQILTGFEIVCNDCHLVHHMGRAVLQGLGDRAEAHFRRVNGISAAETMHEKRLAQALHMLRSRLVWKQDLSFLDAYLAKHGLKKAD